jgi:hypothetical protein
MEDSKKVTMMQASAAVLFAVAEELDKHLLVVVVDADDGNDDAVAYIVVVEWEAIGDIEILLELAWLEIERIRHAVVVVGDVVTVGDDGATVVLN